MTAAGKTRARKTSLSISHHPTDNDDDDQNDDDGNDGGDDEKICERSADLPRLATTSRTPTLETPHPDSHHPHDSDCGYADDIFR